MQLDAERSVDGSNCQAKECCFVCRENRALSSIFSNLGAGFLGATCRENFRLTGSEGDAWRLGTEEAGW
jgi:hypothetical protein